MMQVKFWNGKTENATNREEAVRILQAGLQAWMQKGDKILWYKQPKDAKLPSFAAVVNELGEETDANAMIKGVDDEKIEDIYKCEHCNAEFKESEIFYRHYGGEVGTIAFCPRCKEETKLICVTEVNIMKAINRRAKKVMDLLIEGVVPEASDSKKIDNAKGAFMTVHIEYVCECNLGEIYSVAHYYTQNGDLMRDPDMEFLKGGGGEYYPLSFWQDSPLTRDEPVNWGQDGNITSYNKKRQADLVTFANMWMKNIKQQQGLVV